MVWIRLIIAIILTVALFFVQNFMRKEDERPDRRRWFPRRHHATAPAEGTSHSTDVLEEFRGVSPSGERELANDRGW